MTPECRRYKEAIERRQGGSRSVLDKVYGGNGRAAAEGQSQNEASIDAYIEQRNRIQDNLVSSKWLLIKEEDKEIFIDEVSKEIIHTVNKGLNKK